MSCVVASAGIGIDVTVCMTTDDWTLPRGARSWTVPPTLVDTDISVSAVPLFLMSRYPTVDCPLDEGCCTQAPVRMTPAPPACLREAQPMAPSPITAVAPERQMDRGSPFTS